MLSLNYESYMSIYVIPLNYESYMSIYVIVKL